MSYSLFLKKQNFKFSSAHFTLFNKTSAERLHGHNYKVGLRLKGSKQILENSMICDFNTIKKNVRTTCDLLDEKVLIPTKSKFLKIESAKNFKDHTHIVFSKKNYILPNEDIFLIDCDNITSESLAYFLAQELAPQLKSYFSHLSVSVEETSGQMAIFSMAL